jgi:hypothetical protein
MDNNIVPAKPASMTKPKADIDGFIEQRQDFIQKVTAICVEGKDFHVIQGKKSLAKGGAEKIASIFNWQAKFSRDMEALEMLGNIIGLVAYKCTLEIKGKFVGEGRGAAVLSKNGSDPNKTLKMAQKSAYIDAVIRASGLSDFFTQDLEDMPADQIGGHGEADIAPTKKQLEYIAMLCKQKGFNKEDLFEFGFTKLTGGKNGTASELIEFLKTTPSRNVIEQDVLPYQSEDQNIN